MAETASTEGRTRGYRKREKTRRQLVAAGIRVLAEKGEGMTVSDVVAAAEVSTGTFYNYFLDRDELLDAVSEQWLLTLVETAAREPIDDPAERFAVATSQVLQRAVADPIWGQLIVRLLLRGNFYEDVARFPRADLAAGRAAGRFVVGDEDAALDQVIGLVVMTIRRIVAGEAGPDTPTRAVERGLAALGVPPAEARDLAESATAKAAVEPASAP